MEDDGGWVIVCAAERIGGRGSTLTVTVRGKLEISFIGRVADTAVGE